MTSSRLPSTSVTVLPIMFSFPECENRSRSDPRITPPVAIAVHATNAQGENDCFRNPHRRRQRSRANHALFLIHSHSHDPLAELDLGRRQPQSDTEERSRCDG